MDLEDASVMCTEAVRNPHKNLIGMAELLFEKFSAGEFMC